MSRAKYFTDAEFRRCSPACSIDDMKQDTLDRLDLARETAGIPFVLNSAYRSPEWERSKGRSGDGAHTKGRAVDIRCGSDGNRYKIVLALIVAGFCRIGIGKNYIHADDDGTRTQNVIWHYYN